MSSPRDMKLLQLKQLRSETATKITALEQELRRGAARTYTITQDGRELRFSTAQLIRYYSKWISYYDGAIAQRLAAADAIRKPELVRRIPVLPVLLLSIVAILGLAALIEPTLTGFVTKQPKLYSDTVDRVFTTSTQWQFTPEQQKAGERITSLKLTGSLEGSGTARVLLDGIAIIDYTLAPVSTDMDTNSSNASIATDSSGDAGLAQLTGQAVIAKSSEQFTLECVDSCTLDIPARDTYTLTVEVSGVRLEIDTASYTIEAVAKATSTASSTQNISNATTPLNVSINATNATLEWTKTGTDAYETIPASNVSMFGDNTGIVTITALLPINGAGTLVAKTDYVNSKRFAVFVNAEGTIAVELSDGETSIDLETEEIYTDGSVHTIRIALSDSQAMLLVDGSVAAVADITAVNDISTTAPMSVGADLAYVDWIGEAIETLIGEVSAVHIEYQKGGSQ